ncbi:hypothetical protein JK364_52425 [Streptomyces sp. 110]|uniref:Peptidase inhibitor family I36 n=1 Tax=Streptomyces endocoffeicus TaxID=2898945 RepID=A0ABS1Q8X0_9ACTN|nr:hypothetical protein [Streptomyces endocoffeicus]MBL1120810.1 hypothetical protein [Streptomyces endocoffeicus]
MHHRIAATAAMSAALVAVLASAPTASAEPSPPNCPSGNVCVFDSNTTTDGPAVIKTAGDWRGSHQTSIVGSTIFNNGTRQPGHDHIQATWVSNGRLYDRCLHFNPGPGDYKLIIGDHATITSLTWRGECDF